MGQTSADDHLTLAYFRGSHGGRGEATEDAGQGKAGAGYCRPSIRLCGWAPPPAELRRHSAPVGRSCRAVKRQLPPHGGTLLLPGAAALTRGRQPTLELSRMKDAEHLTFSVAITLSPLKLTGRMFVFPFFSPLCCYVNQRSEDQDKYDIWEARHINQYSHYKRALNGQFDASSLPHIKTMLVLPLICSVACGKEDTMPPVAKRSSAVSTSDFLASDRHAMPLKCE